MKEKDIHRCSCPEGWKLEIHSPVEPTMKILNTLVQRQKKTKENAYISRTDDAPVNYVGVVVQRVGSSGTLGQLHSTVKPAMKIHSPVDYVG